MLRPVIGAISLLSRIPFSRITMNESDIKKSVMNFPLVGILAFISFYISYTILFELGLDNYLAILLSMAITYYLFNMLHFDGFLDSIDGLLSQKSKDETLEIFKKGNTGPNGIFYGVIYILIKIYFLENMQIVNLLAVFVISRWSLSFACVLGHPARNEGLGYIVLRAKNRYLLIATLYLLIIPFVCNIRILHIEITMLLVIAVTYLIILLCTKRIGGITGDILGFINEINELIVLGVLYRVLF